MPSRNLLCGLSWRVREAAPGALTGWRWRGVPEARQPYCTTQRLSKCSRLKLSAPCHTHDPCQQCDQRPRSGIPRPEVPLALPNQAMKLESRHYLREPPMQRAASGPQIAIFFPQLTSALSVDLKMDRPFASLSAGPGASLFLSRNRFRMWLFTTLSRSRVKTKLMVV